MTVKEENLSLTIVTIAATAAATAFLFEYLWRQWPLFVGMFAALYFSGFFVYRPRSWILGQNILTGLLFGLVFGTAAWLYSYVT